MPRQFSSSNLVHLIEISIDVLYHTVFLSPNININSLERGADHVQEFCKFWGDSSDFHSHDEQNSVATDTVELWRNETFRSWQVTYSL